HRHIGGGHGNTDAHPITGGDHNHSISISYSKFNNKGDTESRKTPFNDGQNHRGNSNTDTNYHKGKSHHHSISTNHNHGTSNQSNGGVHHTQQMDTSGAHEHAEGEHDHSWNNEPEHYMLAFIIKISDT
ncbi:MAG: hypothetical protein VW397_05090, partial [Candidatus Margulisiibacteriota bacterium]